MARHEPYITRKINNRPLKHQLILMDRRGPFQSRNFKGGEVWAIYWYDVATGQMFMTYVDSNMDNFADWRELVQSKTPHGVYGNLTEKPDPKQKFGMPVIDADSTPEPWMTLTREQAYEVAELDQDQRSTPSTFSALFD
jgi:hypothetical protein